MSEQPRRGFLARCADFLDANSTDESVDDLPAPRSAPTWRLWIDVTCDEQTAYRIFEAANDAAGAYLEGGAMTLAPDDDETDARRGGVAV